MSIARPVTRGGVTRRAFNRLLTAGCGCGGLNGLALGGAARAQDVHYLRIGTGDVGGVYFRIGGILANVFSDPGYNTDCSDNGLCGVPGLIAVAQSKTGSVENLLALQTGAAVTFLSVFSYVENVDSAQALQDLGDAVRATVGEEDFARLTATFEVSYAPSPEAGIVDVASEYDMVVMGHRPQSRLSQAVWGSVMGEVKERGPVPVLVVR